MINVRSKKDGKIIDLLDKHTDIDSVVLTGEATLGKGSTGTGFQVFPNGEACLHFTDLDNRHKVGASVTEEINDNVPYGSIMIWFKSKRSAKRFRKDINAWIRGYLSAKNPY